MMFATFSPPAAVRIESNSVPLAGTVPEVVHPATTIRRAGFVRARSSSAASISAIKASPLSVAPTALCHLSGNRADLIEVLGRRHLDKVRSDAPQQHARSWS